MSNMVDDPAHAGLKAELARRLDELFEVAEDPDVPVPAWREMSVPERVAAENEYDCLIRRTGPMERYRAAELDAYLGKAVTPAQKERLEEAAEQVYDFPFFGRLFALEGALKGGYTRYQARLPDLRRELDAHQQKHRELLAERARQIL